MTKGIAETLKKEGYDLNTLYSVIFSVKYSTDKGKTMQEESGFKTGNDAQNFAWSQHRKGAVIYGLYKNGKII